MLTREKIAELVALVGSNIHDDGEWAQLAAACADQSGCDVKTQAKMRDLLGLDSPDCPYCRTEVPYLRGDGKLHHTGGVLCQDPEGQP